MTDRIHDVFASAGYGEVSTPSLEYEGTFDRSDAGGRPAYRVFDEQGNVLILRTDMTVPIARLVATRYAGSEPPAALLLFRPRLPRRPAPARPVPRVHAGRGRADRRPGTAGDRRGAGGAVRGPGCRRAATTASGWATRRCIRRCWRASACRPNQRERIIAELARGDFVAVEHEVRELGLAPADAELLLQRAPAARRVRDPARLGRATARRGRRDARAA